jgi:hypothetical protein
MPGPRGIIKVLGDHMASRLIDIGTAPGQREVNERRPEESKEVAPATTRYVPKARPGEDVKEVALREEFPDPTVDRQDSLLGDGRGPPRFSLGVRGRVRLE